MSKNDKAYKHGSRLGVHITKLVDEDFLEFLNKQTNISGVALLGLLELYRTYGEVDLIELVPRRFSLNSARPIPLEQRHLMPQQQPQVQPVVMEQQQPQVQPVATEQQQPQQAFDILSAEEVNSEEPGWGSELETYKDTFKR